MCIFFSHQIKMFFRSLKMLASALAAAYFFFRARSLMGGAGRLAPGMAPPRPMDPALPLTVFACRLIAVTARYSRQASTCLT